MALYFRDRSEFIAYFQAKLEGKLLQSSAEIKFENKNNSTKLKAPKSKTTKSPNGINAKGKVSGYLVDRWDYLYQLEKSKKSKFEQIREEHLKNSELKLMQECTFKPVFISNSHSKSRNLQVQDCNLNNINSRSEIWARKRDAKNNYLKQKLSTEMLEECKFHPKTVKIYLLGRIQASVIKHLKLSSAFFKTSQTHVMNLKRVRNDTMVR